MTCTSFTSAGLRARLAPVLAAGAACGGGDDVASVWGPGDRRSAGAGAPAVEVCSPLAVPFSGAVFHTSLTDLSNQEAWGVLPCLPTWGGIEVG